ncbi:hypothetical protein C8D93_106229 [Sinimarinibacterium flocculans]|uniref:Competence protein CoiA-like protein n=2 Tax=Sinimarinibacterium flocculans TaxID=985250 RepID=A0A318E8A0_9GAMM|nr:hypothetical protein C8D93_106229 [Sinimarinibacterium flocculans]
MALGRDDALVFALDAESGALRHVREGATGQRCNCVCPGCGQALEAVNAEAKIYKRRPHFRHLDGQTVERCAGQALAAAIESAMRTVDAIPLPPILPGAPLLDVRAETVDAVAIERFEIVDYTEGLLVLPDGREFRVSISAHDVGHEDGERTFDLVLHVPEHQIESLESVEGLRSYLTLDKSAWRWCRRQTTPSLVGQSAGAESRAAQLAVLGDPDFSVEPGGDVPGGEQLPPSQTHRESRPIYEWTVRIPGRDGTVTLLHRQRWPNGVMTERVERLAASDLEKLI